MTVSIRASLILSALGMAALTAAFAAPDTGKAAAPAAHAIPDNLHRDARQSQGASTSTTTPNSVRPISTQLNVYSKIGNCVQLTDKVVTMVATPSTTPERGCASSNQNTTKSTAQTPYQNHTAHSGAGP